MAVWRSIRDEWEKIMGNIYFQVGNGLRIRIWIDLDVMEDPWQADITDYLH